MKSVAHRVSSTHSLISAIITITFACLSHLFPSMLHCLFGCAGGRATTCQALCMDYRTWLVFLTLTLVIALYVSCGGLLHGCDAF